MIHWIKNLEKNFSVSKAALIIAVSTLVSKIFGLIRDPLLSSKIGVGETLDTYYSAFRVPDFIFNLLVLGTLSVSLIPVFTEWVYKDKNKANEIASSVLNASLTAMLIICGILFLTAAPITKFLVPGFSGEQLDNTIKLMRLFLLSPIIFTISNFFTSILSSYKKFLILSIAPILYNIGILIGLFFFYPKFGIMGLGFGVILGALMHLFIQAPAAFKEGFSWKPVFDLNNQAVKKIAKLFFPRIFGMDISQISLIIATTVGSILASGSVTIFNQANNLQAAPLGIFAISISTASFPLLSEYFATKNDSGYVKTLAKNFRLVLFFIIPITVLMLIYRAYIVRIIYGHGKYGWDDTVAMFTTFGILTFSLIAQSLTPLLSRSFYSRQNTIIPVVVNMISIVLDIILAYTLGKRFGLSGIAWGFVIACTFDAIVMFFALRWFLEKANVSLKEFDAELAEFIPKILLSSILMGLVAYGGVYATEHFVDTQTTIGIMVQSAISIFAALITFILCAYALEIEQAKWAIAFLKKVFSFKSKPQPII
jgi:putative peptidoglycan lipid II flippase